MRTATHNLSEGLPRFLGREAELAELAEVLGDTRLVTLTGAPGIGKTRLAIELSRRLVGDRPDGAWLVELAPVVDGELVPARVAAALSVAETAGESLTDTLLVHLGTRAMVLVLDNCEHLTAACAGLVEALHASCPELWILATSREPLSLPAETAWQVPPLAVPDEGVTLLDERSKEYSGVDLFVERARAIEPGFELTEYVAPAVAEICRRVDGMPLAIELAAARVGMLTPAEISRRLDDRFSLLTKGHRGAVLPRRQTLEAALDWSYTMLATPERALLRRLAVFVGGFGPDAAQAVSGGEGVTPSKVPHLLARLVAKSLVSAEGDGSYLLLETIRAYAGERLDEAGEAATLREAHARFYLGLAEAAEPRLTGPEQDQWLERLEADHQNLRSALDWSLSHGRREWSLRLAGALVLFWRVRGHFTEGRELLEASLSASHGESPLLESKALWGAGFLAHMAGDSEGAIPLLEKALAQARELGEKSVCARALLILGNCWQYRDAEKALALLEESAQIAREAGDTWCLAHALGVAGFARAYAHELSDARALLEECLAVAREAGDKQGRRFGLMGLANVAVGQGDYGVAEPMLEECLALAEELGEDYTKAWALQYLGLVASARGQYERARGLLDDALALTREARSADLALPLVARARVARAEGDLELAAALADEALAIGRAGVGIIPALQVTGDLAIARGDVSGAARLLDEARELARADDNKAGEANALSGLALLAQEAGDGERAAALAREALELHGEIGQVHSITETLEAIAGYAASAGHHLYSARLLGAAENLRGRGYARPPWLEEAHQAAVASVRKALSTEELESAWSKGVALSIHEAVAYAAKGPGRGERPTEGWSSLTEREREVAALVGEGLTNRQIGERLFVSPWTVKTHVAHVFEKLGLTRRSELAREVSRRAGPGAERTGSQAV